MLAENERARQDEQKSPHLLVSWQGQLIDRHRGSSTSTKQLDPDDVAAITGYLHEAGQIFHLRHNLDSAILVDQEWATGLIYEMFRPGGALSRKIKHNGGWFYPADFEEDRDWRDLGSDLERDQMLTYMRECGVVVRLAARDENRADRDVYLATEKWLLPEYSEVEQRVEALMKHVRGLAHMSAREKFAFEERSISEFDFRALLKHLGAVYGTNAIWFRDGLQASPADVHPEWCIRVRWMPAEKDGFLGRVDAVLIATEPQLESLTRQVEEIFAAEGSPTAYLPKPRRVSVAEHDLSHGYFRGLKDSDFDVAVSSSGADKEAITELVDTLKAAGLRVNWYRDLDCRSDEYAKVMTFVLSLRKPPCILLYLSDHYLHDDPLNNWYCPWELADAINRIEAAKRTVARTLVIYAEGGKLSSQNLNDVIVPLFNSMAEHFGAAYAGKPVPDRPNFKYYDEISGHFLKAVQSQACAKFFAERGTLGAYSQVVDGSDGKKDFSSVIADIQKALRS